MRQHPIAHAGVELNPRYDRACCVDPARAGLRGLSGMPVFNR